ncbi:ArsR/SmtB family transcription factor [Roseospira visakhapatnamensis]|uniref:ArsR family transcriptional regulator n=1 Tax=Roseospira visakhapatnamensis TaxID=390880 RepID=A0A7W6RA53_9PROT|nr:metalloregulator ArsR/SmtB family transcription factor [Roseospira visakhapatnamensis]MBB4264630.1 ArsR family transcriptional regulator [Roseospira visakhapatnamensis]
MNVDRLHAHTARAAALLKALANDRRLRILCTLADGERTVGALEATVGLGQSALSQHLARLRREGLVATRREAQHIHYRLTSPEAQVIIDALANLYCPGDDDPAPNT